MKTLLAATLLATLLATSTAFALELPVSQPPKGTEGPDVRFHAERQPILGEERPVTR